MKVLGMGNALVDVLTLMDDDRLLDQLGLPKGSMQLIDEDRKNAISKVIETKETHIVSGGSASNTIVGLAKLGVETGFIGKIGKDKFGQYYKDDIEKAGVHPHLIVSDKDASGIATAFVSKDGQRTFATFLGAASELNVEDLKEDDFKGYDYFYIEGYLVQNLDLIRGAIKMAKNQGAKVIIDMASYNVVESTRDFLLEIIPEYVDIIFANEEEANALLHIEPEKAVEELAKQVEIAVVKVGANGSWVQKGNDKEYIPALKVNCIDTTGAGDLYASGFIYGLINGKSLQEAAKIGTLLAGDVIQVVGPKISDEKWKEINELISR